MNAADGSAAVDRSERSAGEVLRVMVVDDHHLFRSGLCRLLEQEEGLAVVAAASRGEEAVQHAAQLLPDVVVMDLNMPGMSGAETIRGVLAGSPRSAILILTISDSDDEVLDAVLAGASGYLLKEATLPEIIRAIRAAGAGQSMIAPRVAGGLLARLRRHGIQEQHSSIVVDLSDRELDVLTLLVAGCDNLEMARQLHLSPSTVKHHVSSILVKLEVDNRIQAAVLAVRCGLA
jgi:DNA-binding NarL/FixJ family response regulator